MKKLIIALGFITIAGCSKQSGSPAPQRQINEDTLVGSWHYRDGLSPDAHIEIYSPNQMAIDTAPFSDTLSGDTVYAVTTGSSAKFYYKDGQLNMRLNRYAEAERVTLSWSRELYKVR